MFIVYLILGIVSGLIAAAVALLSGASFLMAVLAYGLGGIAGMIAGLVWSHLPKQTKPTKQPATQRS